MREQQPWLDVPYTEKDEARAAGARWDRRARRWYAPRPGMAELARWLPVPRAAPPPDDDAVPAPDEHEPLEEDVPERAVGAGEARLARVLSGLTEPGTLARLTRRRPPWRVLHAVPLGGGHGDVDHVLLGAPGVVTVHPVRRPEHRVDDELAARVRADAERAGRLLALAAGAAEPPAATTALVVVGGEVAAGREHPLPGVLVTTPVALPRLVAALPAVLSDGEIDDLYAVARRLGTWTREL